MSEILRQYYDNGNIRSEIEYQNNVPHGMFLAFHENGMLQLQTTYKHGKINGNYKVFDEFGDVVVEANYKDNLRDGKYIVRYPRSQGGSIYDLSFYENGLLEGDKVSFYNTGEVMSITKYKAGKPQTYPKYYDKSGNEIKTICVK